MDTSSDIFRIRATLVNKQTDSWVLLPEEKKSCPRCEAHGGCASMQLVQAFRFKQHFLKVPAPEHFSLEEGQDLWLCVARRQLNQSALLMYGVPLTALLVGAMSGMLLGELYAVAFALSGLLLSYFLLMKIARKAPKFELQRIN